MKKLFFLFLFCALLGAKEIKIGVILPLSGIFEQLGQEALNGIYFAHLQEPSIENYEIKLIVKNSNSDKIDAKKDAKELIEQEEVSALLGGIASNSAYEIAKIANRFRIPFVVVGATNFKVTANKKYATRICFSDPYQGEMIAKWALENNLTKAILINFPNEDFSLELVYSFKRYFRKHNGEIIKSFNLDATKKDYSNELANIDTLKTDIIVITGYYPEAARVVKILRQKEVNATIVGSDALHYQEYLDLAKDAANGVVVVGGFSEESVKGIEAKEFIKEYRLKNLKKPNFLTVLGAEAYDILLEAINRCIQNGKGAQNPRCINDNLRNLKNFSTIEGIISIDKNGNAIKPIIFDIVKNGAFNYLQTIYPSQPKKETK